MKIHLSFMVAALMSFCFGVLFASPSTAQVATGPITEGVSFESILIGKSTFDDVISTYGNDFKMINHKDYSLELEYKKLGLSFNACFEDPNREVFSVGIRKPASAFTTKGIFLGRSTLGDVLDRYGDSNERVFSDSDQGGVYFFVSLKDDPNKAYESEEFEPGSEAEKNYKLKTIVRIDLVEPTGLRQCDSEFPKADN